MPRLRHGATSRDKALICLHFSASATFWAGGIHVAQSTGVHVPREAAATMNGRRRHPRFLLPEPLDGVLRVRDEVAIDRWDGEEVEVVAPAPCRPGEELVLEVTGNGHKPLRLVVRESRPFVAADGAIRHRILLAAGPGAVAVDEGNAS